MLAPPSNILAIRCSISYPEQEECVPHDDEPRRAQRRPRYSLESGKQPARAKQRPGQREPQQQDARASQRRLIDGDIAKRPRRSPHDTAQIERHGPLATLSASPLPAPTPTQLRRRINKHLFVN